MDDTAAYISKPPIPSQNDTQPRIFFPFHTKTDFPTQAERTYGKKECKNGAKVINPIVNAREA